MHSEIQASIFHFGWSSLPGPGCTFASAMNLSALFKDQAVLVVLQHFCLFSLLCDNCVPAGNNKNITFQQSVLGRLVAQFFALTAQSYMSKTKWVFLQCFQILRQGITADENGCRNLQKCQLSFFSWIKRRQTCPLTQLPNHLKVSRNSKTLLLPSLHRLKV